MSSNLVIDFSGTNIFPDIRGCMKKADCHVEIDPSKVIISDIFFRLIFDNPTGLRMSSDEVPLYGRVGLIEDTPHSESTFSSNQKHLETLVNWIVNNPRSESIEILNISLKEMEHLLTILEDLNEFECQIEKDRMQLKDLLNVSKGYIEYLKLQYKDLTKCKEKDRLFTLCDKNYNVIENIISKLEKFPFESKERAITLLEILTDSTKEIEEAAIVEELMAHDPALSTPLHLWLVGSEVHIPPAYFGKGYEIESASAKSTDESEPTQTDEFDEFINELEQYFSKLRKYLPLSKGWDLIDSEVKGFIFQLHKLLKLSDESSEHLLKEVNRILKEYEKEIEILCNYKVDKRFAISLNVLKEKYKPLEEEGISAKSEDLNDDLSKFENLLLELRVNQVAFDSFDPVVKLKSISRFSNLIHFSGEVSMNHINEVNRILKEYEEEINQLSDYKFDEMFLKLFSDVKEKYQSIDEGKTSDEGSETESSDEYDYSSTEYLDCHSIRLNQHLFFNSIFPNGENSNNKELLSLLNQLNKFNGSASDRQKVFLVNTLEELRKHEDDRELQKVMSDIQVKFSP